MTSETILITGATGHIGRHLATRLAQRPDTRLILSSSPRSADRLADLARRLGPRTSPHVGDLRGAEPFAGLDGRGVTRIVHAAALTQFSVDRDAAHAVNVDGTRALLGFARRCPNLRRVTLLSTLYVAGLRAGPIPATLQPRPPAFANAYEESKWLAERVVADNHDDLPWQIVRLPTVIADDADGRVGQHNAVHNALRLLFNGLLPVIPGRPEVALHLATAAEVVDALAPLVLRPGVSAFVNLVPDAGQPETLGGIIAAADAAFRRDPVYRGRVAQLPPWSDWASFAALSEAVGRFSGDLVRQAARAITPFARQLYVDHAVAPGPWTATQPRAELIARVCARLLATRWRTA